MTERLAYVILLSNTNNLGRNTLMNENAMFRPHSRRDFLKGSAAAMAVAAAYGLAPARGLAANVPNQFDGSKFQLAEPNPKRGGVLRVCQFGRIPHFDVHQSATFANIGSQGCMFDNLVRRD